MHYADMMAKIAAGDGFIAALDQSGGSTPKALKGFAATGSLAPGEARAVSLTLSAREMSVFDPAAGAWARVPPRAYAVYVGASAGDVRLVGSVRVE